jgi:4-amino-4-deoxy-L-arabinose transferase-like glycosyltransferase
VGLQEKAGPILFLVILFIAFLLRGLTLFSPELLKVPDPSFFITRPRDMGIIGLMSLRVLAGEFPAFFYGQNFMGSLEAFLNSPLFLLLGASPYTLQVLPILNSVIFIFLVYLLARRVSGVRVARLTSLWLALPPVFLMKWNVEARSHYPLTLILGTALILLTCRIITSRDRHPNQVLTMTAWGLIAGLGFWTNLLMMAYILPSAFLLWVEDKKVFFKAGFLALLGGLILGALPFLLFQGVSGWPILQVTQALGSLPATRLIDLLTNALPILVGLVPPIRGAGRQGILVYLSGLYLASLGYFLFRQRRGLWSLLTFRRTRTDGSELLVLLLLTNLLLSLFTVFSQWLSDHCQRYLLPTYTAIPIILFTFLREWKGRFGRWVLVLATAFLMVFHFWGNFVQDTWLVLRPQKYQVFRERLTREYEMAEFLQNNGYDRIYAEESIGKKAMLLGGKPLVFSDPYQEVYLKFAELADAGQKTGFLFYGENPLFENTLIGAGGNYRKIIINDLYTLYGDFIPPPASQLIPRQGWSGKGWPESGKSADLFDSDVDTGWSVPQVPGAALLIDMGQVNPVNRIFFIPYSHREVPAGFQVEVSENGWQWTLVSRISAYWGPFFWSGPHPMIKVRQGRVEIAFPEVKARYLKLTLTAGDKHRNWSVAEFFVGKPRQEDPLNHSDQRLPDLLRFLQVNHIPAVYADHWLSAVLRVQSGRQLLTMASNRFLNDNGAEDPAPEHRSPVSFNPGSAFVLEKGDALFFSQSIEPGGRECDRRTLGPYKIFYNCRKKEEPALDSAGWKVSANVNEGEAGKVVDGLRRTRWSSEKPQHPGMFFEVDLGKIFSVGGVALSLGDSRKDFPRRLKVLGSRDGKTWGEIETEWTSDFHWAGNVLLRMRGERIDYFFNPVEVRFLKLLQEGSDPKYYWSIHELTVYGKRPGG